MKNSTEILLDLQNLEIPPGSPLPEAKQQIETLRKSIPESLLTKFDRWMARGRKAVAVVHKGVCGECHLKLPIGVVGALTFGDEIQHCGNCGRFLYLPEDEPTYAPNTPDAVKAKPAYAARRKKEPAHAS